MVAELNLGEGHDMKSWKDAFYFGYIGKLKRNFRQKQAQMNEKVSVHSIYALEFGKEGLSGYFYLHST